VSRNWEQERAEIDRGWRGDKVPVSDPAAAPLGADEEAAGARTKPSEIGKGRAEPVAPHGTESGGSAVPLVAIGTVAAATVAALLLVLL
jgi:hypothetical protein